MRRLVFLLLIPCAALVGVILGALITLQYLPSGPEPQIDPAVLTTKAPAPEPVVSSDPVAADERPAPGQSEQEDTILAELAPAAAPILVTDEEPALPGPPAPPAASDVPDTWVSLADGQMVAVFQPSKRKASELLSAVELTGARALADADTNSLIVRGSEAELRATQFLLEQLDRNPAPTASRLAGKETVSHPRELRIYECPESLQGELCQELEKQQGITVARKGEIIAVSATPEQHQELTQLIASLSEDRAIELAHEAKAADDQASAATLVAAADQEIADPLSPTEAPAAVIDNIKVEDSQHSAIEAPCPRIAVDSYRIATSYLANEDLQHLADKNRCVAALRAWLGNTKAGRFAASEVEACLQLLLGLGLIAPAQSRELAVQTDGAPVEIFVDAEGKVTETATDGSLEELRVGPSPDATLKVSLGSADEASPPTVVANDEAAMALLTREQTPEHATDVLVVIRPVVTASAQTKSTAPR